MHHHINLEHTRLLPWRLKSRLLTHVASDLYEPSKASAVATIASYSNKELIGWTSGTQSQRWETAKIASKALLDATTGYKLDYSAPASQEEAMANYDAIWREGDQRTKIIFGVGL